MENAFILISPHEIGRLFSSWQQKQTVILNNLINMAGSTETEFLRIGGTFQNVYSRTIHLNETANNLLSVATGEQIRPLLDHFNDIVENMESSLREMEDSIHSKTRLLQSIDHLLGRIVQPLEGFIRMSRQLNMLEVSIKIESSCLDESESEFINLAQNIKQLSKLIKEKAEDLHILQLRLNNLIERNLTNLESVLIVKTKELHASLTDMTLALDNLHQANSQFAQLGEQVVATSDENSENLSTIVQSLQIHDIFRQRIEHIIAVLDELKPALSSVKPEKNAKESEQRYREYLGRIGDVCELQEAQLNYAASDFQSAVQVIVDNMEEMATKQDRLTCSLFQQLKLDASKGGSFIDAVQHSIEKSSFLLEECSRLNSAIVETMHLVSGNVEQMTEHVGVIENISSEIIIVSLNARIEAVGTNKNGRALSILAEEIGMLSNEAVQQTCAITETLAEIRQISGSLPTDADEMKTGLSTKLDELREDARDIITSLKEMGIDLRKLTDQVREESSEVIQMVEGICHELDIHHHVQENATSIAKELFAMHSKAREYVPAGDNLKEELKRLTDAYTMDSERRIHQEISNRYDIEEESVPMLFEESSTDSEFGDNVDLF